MKLFNRTILLVLSWVMLIAVLMSSFMGRVGIALLLLFSFALLRAFSPGQTMFKKVVHQSPESRRSSPDIHDPEQEWGSARPNIFQFSLLRFLITSCIIFLGGVIPVDRIVENASGFFIANQGNPRLILGVIAGALSLIVWDLQNLKQHAWLFGSQEPS